MNVAEAWLAYCEAKKQLEVALADEQNYLADQVPDIEPLFLPWVILLGDKEIEITRFFRKKDALDFRPTGDGCFELWYYNAPKNKGITRCKYVWKNKMWKAVK